MMTSTWSILNKGNDIIRCAWQKNHYGSRLGDKTEVSGEKTEGRETSQDGIIVVQNKDEEVLTEERWREWIWETLWSKIQQ